MASDRRSMMGGFKSISARAGGTGRSTSGPGSRTRTAAALLAAALLYAAGPATAESPPVGDPPVQTERASQAVAREAGATVAAAKARVPMSAAEQAGSPPPASGMRRRFGAGDDGLPLTRAAARQRVEEMSPAAWLAHFGPVSIERHE